jgi:hypothetical protein
MDLAYHDSTKEKIIDLLTYDWPLSLRKIYYLLKKGGSKITYQAVHKAVHQLLDEGKLKKTSEGFLINLDWIKQVHDQTDIIRVNYFSKKRSLLTNVENGKESIQTFVFDTWFDLEKYIYYLQKSTLKHSFDRRSICIHHNHEWRPLFYLRAEYTWIKKLHDDGYKLYTICAGKSAVDEWAKTFYESIGNKVLTGIKLNSPAEIIVFGDLIIAVYIPFELLDSLDKYFSKIRTVKDIDYSWLMETVFNKKSDIKVVINHDRKLSDEIRKHLVSHFKKY